jgi:ferredoxin-NADP reductase
MRFETRWSDAIVRAAVDVTSEVRLLEIVPQNGVQPYAPGSHINVSVLLRTKEGEQADTRSYSLIGEAPVPGAGGSAYRVAVKHHAESRGGSRYMRTLQPGARLRVSNPQNLFVLTFGAPQYLLLAGGIGITPIRSMALALEDAGADFRLLYAGRNAAGMPFAEELRERLGHRLSLFRGDAGRRVDVAAEIATLCPGAEMYMCGPMGLMDAVHSAWRAAGRTTANLRFETFGSGGRLAPEPFVVKVADQNREVLVPSDKTMLSALCEAGIEVLSDCLRGECGLCMVDVLGVEGKLDHRDVFLSVREKAAGGKICTCVSRVAQSEQCVTGKMPGITIDTGAREDHIADQQNWQNPAAHVGAAALTASS